MKRLGFADIEVAIGADSCAAQECRGLVEEVPRSRRSWRLPPSAVDDGKEAVPENSSANCTLTGAYADDPDRPFGQAPSAGRKGCVYRTVRARFEAMRSDVTARSISCSRSRRGSIFAARHIDVKISRRIRHGINDASSDGRNFVSGGVAKAVVNVINEKHLTGRLRSPTPRVCADCRKPLMAAKAGKYNGYLLEGMARPGGCGGRCGTMQSIKKSGCRSRHVCQAGRTPGSQPASSCRADVELISNTAQRAMALAEILCPRFLLRFHVIRQVLPQNRALRQYAKFTRKSLCPIMRYCLKNIAIKANVSTDMVAFS